MEWDLVNWVIDNKVCDIPEYFSIGTYSRAKA